MKQGLLKSALAVAVGLVAFTSCSNDEIEDTTSVVEASQQLAASQEAVTAFDNWLRANYEPYNIKFIYKMDDREADHRYNLTPAYLEQSMRLAVAIKHAWIDAYIEAAGPKFMQENAPRMIMTVGSPAYNDQGTYTLGTAEGGLKITLYMANNFTTDPATLNEYYFEVMHHEFQHILHAGKEYDPSYKDPSSQYYTSAWSVMMPDTAYAKGFVTPYSALNPEEDITEMTAQFLTMTQAQRDTVWKRADIPGYNGKEILDWKLQFCKDYMQEKWDINLDQLRSIVQRRTAEIQNMVLIQPEWMPLVQMTDDDWAYINTPVTRVSAAPVPFRPEFFAEPTPANTNQHNERCAIILQYGVPYLKGFQALNQAHNHSH